MCERLKGIQNRISTHQKIASVYNFFVNVLQEMKLSSQMWTQKLSTIFALAVISPQVDLCPKLSYPVQIITSQSKATNDSFIRHFEIYFF